MDQEMKERILKFYNKFKDENWADTTVRHFLKEDFPEAFEPNSDDRLEFTISKEFILRMLGDITCMVCESDKEKIRTVFKMSFEKAFEPEKPKPGQVWGKLETFGWEIYLVGDDGDCMSLRDFKMLSANFGDILNFLNKFGFKKLASSLEDYYFQKFEKESDKTLEKWHSKP